MNPIDHRSARRTHQPAHEAPKIRSFCRIGFLLFFVCVSILCSCATQRDPSQYIKDGKEYGQVRGTFRYKWWNYYERGLSFADGRFFEEAVLDFKHAIDQRDKDQRMARTYGMHFVDYFPHRELGVVYYLKGELSAAQDELTRSLSQYPTSKARFYLDRVRKRLMEQKGGEIAPPSLVLHRQEEAFWTRDDPVVISGDVRDPHFVSAVSIQGDPIFMDGAQDGMSFSRPLDLDQGTHTIQVEATNLMGKSATRDIVIHVDRQGPLITVESVFRDAALPEKGTTLRGSIYDEAGVSQFEINGRPVPFRRGQEILFSETLPKDSHIAEIVAVDRLGNRTLAHVDASIPGRGDRPLMVACAGSDITGLMVAGIFGPKDKEPPQISLKGWGDSVSEAVFVDRVFVDGHAADETAIESLTLNEKPILRRKGKRIFFNQVIRLNEGQNRVVIEARDGTGNVATRELIIVRKIPKALQLVERLSMTVLPFGQGGEVSNAGLSFQNSLTDALVERNRFRLVERQKLDVILQEQKLSRSSLIDKKTALDLGRLVAAQTIVTGDIVESGTGIEVIGRVIDTETSEILASEDVYDEVKDIQALQTLAEGMAIRIHRQFPLVTGTVVQHKGDWIFTDIGDDKIGLQDRLIVYREEPIKHPVAGKLMGSDNEIIGKARVVQVMTGMSKAELSKGAPAVVRPMDKVISQ
jgi:TolB-like protein